MTEEVTLEGHKVYVDGTLVHTFPDYIEVSEVRLVHCESTGLSVSYKGYDNHSHRRVFGSILVKEC